MFKLSIPDCDSGMTIIELLVASTISMALFAAAFGTTMSIRSIYSMDLVRTRLNQNVRAAVDFVGTEIRQAGERLPAGVLALEVIDGSSGAADTLVLRRNVLDEVLTVCEDLTAGSSTSRIYLSTSTTGVSPACVYGGQSNNLTAWEAYRNIQDGTVKAYIYNFATQEGEFIEYTDGADTGTAIYIDIASKSLLHNYPPQASAIYTMIEWRFQLDPTSNAMLLQVIENQDIANPKNLAFGISDFQIEVIMTDGSVLTDFGAGQSWTLLEAVEVSISGVDQSRNHANISTNFRSRFFPRNILSL